MKVDAITMGNHTWGKKDIFSFADDPKLLRPANYAPNVPGHGYGIFDCKGKKICVVNLIGRTDMNVLSENPFLKMNDVLNAVKGKADIIILDFHAEATAEKIAMPSGSSIFSPSFVTKNPNRIARIITINLTVKLKMIF